MIKILVTGAAGNIGSSLVKHLLDKEKYFIVAVDNLSTGNIYKLPSQSDKLKFIKANVNDYNDISAIFSSYHFDYIFHFAALVGVKRTLENPLSVLKDIDGIHNVLSLAKNSGAKRIFYSSSSEVYGEPVSIPQNENTTPLNSRLPYAIVKNIGEAYCRSYFQEHELSYTIFRFFNTYGPNQSEDFVIPKFLNAALENKPLIIYGDGSQTRTFCFINDNVETMTKCLESNLFINDIINIGSNLEYTILDLAKIIIRLTNSSSEIKHIQPLAEGDMSRRCPDNSKMNNVLMRSLVTLEEGLDIMIKHKKIFYK
jgi:UDP-glucuronate decarboxylase